MRVIIQKEYGAVSAWAAAFVVSYIKAAQPTPEKPFVLGLPTGSSPVGMYKELIKLHKGNIQTVDFIHIIPDGKEIKIDQIKEIRNSLRFKPQFADFKTALIEKADSMNKLAQNCFLKTLEEPNPDTVIILVTAHPMSLSATIRSRCQILAMNAPEYDVAKLWLEKQIFGKDVELLLSLTENAPLKALVLAQEEGLQQRQEIFDLFDSLYQGVKHLEDSWRFDAMISTLEEMIKEKHLKKIQENPFGHHLPLFLQSDAKD